MLEMLGQDYLRTARAKGVEEQRVVVQHAVKNALIPIVTAIGLQLGGLLSGAFLTETGLRPSRSGPLRRRRHRRARLPGDSGTVLVVAIGFVLINLLVDVAYAIIDPRIHYA